MLDYLKYYVPVAVLAIAIYGLYLGGNAVYAAILSFPVLLIADVALRRDMTTRRMKSRRWAMLPVWICTLGTIGLYLVLAWRVGQGGLTSWQLAGAIAGTAWLSVVPNVPTSHEMYHQRTPLTRFFGRVAQICYLDYTRDIAHVLGHHIDVATPIDSDTARRGQDLYTFTARAVVGSTMTSLRAECDRLEKSGKGRWSAGHRVYKALLALVIALAVMYAIGGWTAVWAALCAMVIARLWAESFNYFQHYGLVRVVGSPVAPRHVWNHLGTIGRTCAFEITNHADHHLDAYKPFYALVPDKTAVRMPSVFVCFLSALIPPLWHRAIIMPALKEWDLKHASPEERKLARAQNRAAGWPDWLASSGAKDGVQQESALAARVNA